MARQARDFSNLLGNLNGISDTQLKAHFGLYEGYVKAINDIEEKLQTADRSKSSYSYGEYAELKRRFAVPYNGTYLHELYFENMSKNGGDAPASDLGDLITKTWGGMDKWKTDLKATGLAVPGWVVLAYEQTTGKLQNIQLAEHHIGWCVNHVPVLVMDTWEHAFMLDYSTKRGDYIDCFIKNIEWKICSQRFAKAKSQV